MDDWTASKYNFMKHLIVLGGSQFTRCFPLPKRVAKIKNQAGSFVFDQVTLQVNLDDQIWWPVNQSFKYTFSSRLR